MSTAMHIGAIPEWTRPDRLAKARAFAGMDQIDLAHALGISVRSVKRYVGWSGESAEVVASMFATAKRDGGAAA